MAMTFEQLKSAADTWVRMANHEPDGPASCIEHREEHARGKCRRCEMRKAGDREAAERHCDLMRQGIWKGSNHRRR